MARSNCVWCVWSSSMLQIQKYFILIWGTEHSVWFPCQSDRKTHKVLHWVRIKPRLNPRTRAVQKHLLMNIRLRTLWPFHLLLNHYRLATKSLWSSVLFFAVLALLTAASRSTNCQAKNQAFSLSDLVCSSLSWEIAHSPFCSNFGEKNLAFIFV